MKTIIHKASERGFADHGWLQTYHSFSFAGYHDPEKVHFGMLRVLNDDTIAPGMGFGEHPHDNMEIITIPISGALEHKDSMGNTSVIRAGEVQIMSAGTGITHSEFNASKSENVHLLQIWLFPNEKNIEPRYDQRTFNPEFRKNRFDCIVSPDGIGESLWINQDAYLSLGRYHRGVNGSYKLKQKGNAVYIFIITGKVSVVGKVLDERDAIEVTETEKVSFIPATESEILIIETPLGI
ncbi:MAG: pirin family protein [Bacteroidota bacterium]